MQIDTENADRRSAVEAAFAKHEAEAAPVEPEAVEAAPVAEVEATVEAPAGVESPAEEEAEAAPAGTRNEKGQFVAKPKAPAPTVVPAAKAPVAPKPGEAVPAAVEAKPATTPPTPAVPAVKPPQSWTPAAREEWAKTPPAVQKEILRREHQMQAALSESAPDRKLAQEFKQAYQPYEAMIRAEGGEPIAAARSLFQTAAALRTGAPGHKAQLVAGLIQQFGVPVELVAAHLDGKVPQGQPQAQAQQPVDPAAIAQQVRADLQKQFAQQAHQAAQKRAASEFEQFSQDPSNEFADHVAETMGDLIEMSARRGQHLSFADAYQQALRLPQHGDIQEILQQRAEAQKATAPAQVAATRRAQVASSSVRSQPAGAAAPAKPQPADLRSQLEAAWDTHTAGSR